MTAIRHRLTRLAEEVKKAGVAGESMQAMLEKVAEREDLTGEEIARVAEMSNRDVQLELHKTASNKRFKFELANAKTACARLRKKSAESLAPTTMISSDTEKLASAIDEAGGDPFAAPYRETPTSITEHQITDERASKLAAEMADVQDREALFALDKARAELEVLHKTGEAQIMRVNDDAESHRKDLVQAAMDLIESNLTLPDLYAACYAAGAGSCNDQVEHKKNVDGLMGLVITGLRERKMPVYRMGFRDYGDPNALEALSNEELLDWCHTVSGYADPNITNAFTSAEGKTAAVEYAEAHPTPVSNKQWSVHMDDPYQLLMDRPSVKDHPVHQSRVDAAKNEVRVFNTNHPFIVSAHCLVGDRNRLVQLHGAQEYLGLKLKQIEEAMSGLAGVRAARNGG